MSLCNRLPSSSPGLTYIGAYAFQCVCRLKLYPRLAITLDIVLRGNSIRHQGLSPALATSACDVLHVFAYSDLFYEPTFPGVY